MELLGDRGLRSVAPQTWPRQIEQTRIVDPSRLGNDRVSDADVDLDAKSCRTEVRNELDALTAVHILEPNRRDTDRAAFEQQTVGLDRQRADFGEDRLERCGIQRAETEQTGVARRTDRFAESDDQHQGALQDEPLRVGRAREAIEKALGREPCEHQVRIDAELVRMADESRLDGLREPSGHAEIAST